MVFITNTRVFFWYSMLLKYIKTVVQHKYDFTVPILNSSQDLSLFTEASERIELRSAQVCSFRTQKQDTRIAVYLGKPMRMLAVSVKIFVHRTATSILVHQAHHLNIFCNSIITGIVLVHWLRHVWAKSNHNISITNRPLPQAVHDHKLPVLRCVQWCS
jgi:hypothetical protein